MAKNKTCNKTQKAHFATYASEERHAKNTIAKLERHVKNSPNDLNAANALEAMLEFGVKYTRDRRAHKPNDTVQKRIRRVRGFSTTQNTFYDEIVPAVPSYAVKKAA